MAEPMLSVGEIAIITTAIANLGGIGYALYKLGGAMTRFELIGTKQAEEIGELKKTTDKIASILADQKVQEQKHADLAARVSRSEQEISDLRRGEGFILPLAGPR
jgi:hypothetical protein